jgi:gliding motility-associated protein GldL
MAKKNSSFLESKGFKIGMKYLYGLGAAVVILGALFKILHLPGASEALIVGLGTEAVIFAISAFEPLPHEDKHYDWKTVFPNIKEEGEVDPDDLPEDALTGGTTSGVNPLVPGMSKTADLLKENKLTPELFENLADSINGLKVNVTQLAEISDATAATNDFSSKVKAAATKMDAMTKGLDPTMEAMKSFGNAINDVKNYQTSVVAVTKNLQSLNSVYELELQDAQKHLNSINKFYGSISTVMNNLLETSKDADALRQEVTKLSTNMQSLNKIYGGMLTAMAGGGK